MSEENRFTNKKVLALSISLVVMIVLAGVFGALYILAVGKNEELSGDYNELYIDYLELSIDFNNLNDQYFILTGEYIELENDFIALGFDLIAMTAEKDNLQIDLNTTILERDNLVIALNMLTIERDGLLSQVDTLNAIILIHLDTITNLNDQISVLKAEILILEGQAIVDNETIATLNAQINILNAEIATHLSTIDGLQTTIDARDATIIDLNAQITNLEIERDNLQTNLIAMTLERDILQIELDNLTDEYNALLGDYQILSDAYTDLQDTYNALEIAYNYITDTIRQSILPVQYSIFAEAVRRYYKDVYIGGLTGKSYWIGFAEFCRDIILHDSYQHNPFDIVSNALYNALRFSMNTMLLAYEIMYNTFYDWLPNWAGWGLTGNELTDINTIVDWCITEINYENDNDIIQGQEYFDWDYIKFPVETAFRTMGDCEDQAILTAAYLESCEFETVIAISHDPTHPTYGAFYHGSLWVHIEDPTTFWSLYPATFLWTIDGGINLWYWIDTTWDVPFGSTPAWLQDYIDYNIPLSWDIITLSLCDIGGSTYTNVGENLGLTYVIPT